MSIEYIRPKFKLPTPASFEASHNLTHICFPGPRLAKLHIWLFWKKQARVKFEDLLKRDTGGGGGSGVCM